MHFNYCSYILVLVDSCVPGDMVTITGIVKVTSTEERKLIWLYNFHDLIGF